MYLNMPRFTFFKKCSIVAAILMAAASGIASTDIPNADAPKTLKENIATPEVPKKYSPAIQRHMGNNAICTTQSRSRYASQKRGIQHNHPLRHALQAKR